MYRSISAVIAATLLSCSFTTSVQAQNRTIDFAFFPPQIDVGEVCIQPVSPARLQTSPEVVSGALGNNQRINFLRRDIARLQAEDPVLWFDFIEALIGLRGRVDPEFAGIEETISRIALYIDAGRMEQLVTEGLVADLRKQQELMDSSQRLTLAQYYLNGIGVEADVPFAQQLILRAAYQGNSNALLQVARFALEGRPIQDWNAPLDVTVSTALGGLLGRVNPGICGRAERIAEEYLNGGVVSRNEDVAYAWYRFAADLGSATGAWRMVEYHLNADTSDKNNAEMLYYLRLAVDRGIAVDAAAVSEIAQASRVTENEILKILGYNFSETEQRNDSLLSRYFQLSLKLDRGPNVAETSYAKYLRELTLLEEAPGWIYTSLAKEILASSGRWVGEDAAILILEEAAARDDGEGMQLLAKLLVRHRDDPARVDQTIGLLMTAVERHGLMDSMNALDVLYRCQLNDAPRMAEASRWARAYRATEHVPLSIITSDLFVLDQAQRPRHLAKLQTHALEGRSRPSAQFAQIVQSNPNYTNSAQRFWAGRINRSNSALRTFAKLEFERSISPAERDLAMELYRRVYLNNGDATGFDLALALLEHYGRDQLVADEAIELLKKSARMGEGAAMRLLAKLQSREGRDPADVFREFERAIDERGDFEAIVFAIPYVSRDKVEDYFDRAVAEMKCNTKDINDLGEAAAIWQDMQLSFQWRNIGLALDYGHSLNKYGVSDPQMDLWRAGSVPSELQIYERLLSEGDTSAYRQLYVLTADPDLKSYDPAAAAVYLGNVAARNAPGDELWVLEKFRAASLELRAAIEAQFDVNLIFLQAIDAGSNEAKYEYAMYLRENARSPSDLASSANFLLEAASSGNIDAMTEYGYTLAYGIGTQRNAREASMWLERAARSGDLRAASLIDLVRVGFGQ